MRSKLPLSLILMILPFQLMAHPGHMHWAHIAEAGDTSEQIEALLVLTALLLFAMARYIIPAAKACKTRHRKQQHK